MKYVLASLVAVGLIGGAQVVTYGDPDHGDGRLEETAENIASD